MIDISPALDSAAAAKFEQEWQANYQEIAQDLRSWLFRIGAIEALKIAQQWALQEEDDRLSGRFRYRSNRDEKILVRGVSVYFYPKAGMPTQNKRLGIGY